MTCPRSLATSVRTVLALGLLCGWSGCARIPTQTTHSLQTGRQNPAAEVGEDPQHKALATELLALADSVRQREARDLASCACEYSRQLARIYGVVHPALFHNFLVNVGVKKRGLCYQWAEDLLAELQTLRLETLQLHWGMARAGTCREHNCIVVTACGQSFQAGIVLDAWRHGGRLTWTRVSADRYPWQEGELTLSSEAAQSSADHP